MRDAIRYLGENSTLPCRASQCRAAAQRGRSGGLSPRARTLCRGNDGVRREVPHAAWWAGAAAPLLLTSKLWSNRVHNRPQSPRPTVVTPRLASAMSAISMRQDPPPTLLGERCNAQGSKKFKRLLLEEDYDSILEIAREQVEFGAHALDISCAVTERPDEAELMRKVVKKLEMGVDVPLVIDTTELDVLEIALKTAPGRCLINSTHLEPGRAKADKIFALAKTHNAAVIVLTIDENGMAKTARPQAGGRQTHLRHCRQRPRPAPRRAGLRCPDLHPRHRRPGVCRIRDRDHRRDSSDQAEPARRADLAGREQPLLRLCPAGPPGPEFDHAPPLRPGRPGYGDRQPRPRRGLCGYPAEEKELAEDLLFNRRPDALQRYIEHFEYRHAAIRRSAQPTRPRA